MKTTNTLSINKVSYEGAILDAIKEAHNANKKIVKLGIPPKIQKELIGMIDTSHNVVDYLKIKDFYGIKVENSKTLQITTEFSIYKRK